MKSSTGTQKKILTSTFDNMSSKRLSRRETIFHLKSSTSKNIETQRLDSIDKERDGENVKLGAMK